MLVINIIMPTKKEILNYLSREKTFFCNNYSLTKIGIFGSYARNEQTSSSDLDIIIEFKENTTDLFEKKIKIKEIINSYFKIHVDICREKAIKPIFRELILKDAIYV